MRALKKIIQLRLEIPFVVDIQRPSYRIFILHSILLKKKDFTRCLQGSVDEDEIYDSFGLVEIL